MPIQQFLTKTAIKLKIDYDCVFFVQEDEKTAKDPDARERHKDAFLVAIDEIIDLNFVSDAKKQSREVDSFVYKGFMSNSCYNFTYNDYPRNHIDQ